MACMTHTCDNCDWDQFNNKGVPDEWPCPKCGGKDFLSIYDEAPTRFDEPDEREDDDDE